MKKNVEKARLDADRSAKPKTRLMKHHPNNGNCIGPQTIPIGMTLLDDETGDSFTVLGRDEEEGS